MFDSNNVCGLNSHTHTDYGLLWALDKTPNLGQSSRHFLYFLCQFPDPVLNGSHVPHLELIVSDPLA